MQTGGKKDAPEYGHQHVREQQSQKTCPINVFRDAPKALRTPSSDTRSCILEAFRPERFSAGTSRKRKRATPKTIYVSGPNNRDNNWSPNEQGGSTLTCPSRKPLL